MSDEFELISVDRVRRGRREEWLYVRPVGQASQGPIIRRGGAVEVGLPIPPSPDAANTSKETTS